MLRDAALSLLRAAGYSAIARQLRHHAQYPADAVALLTSPLPTHAWALQVPELLPSVRLPKDNDGSVLVLPRETWDS
jgi:hypothetical protein